MTTKERILHFIDYKGINQKTFFEDTGIKRGFLDGDKLKASVSDIFIAKIIASYPEINLEWLITGKGEMLKVNIFHEPHSNNTLKTTNKYLVNDNNSSEYFPMNKNTEMENLSENTDINSNQKIDLLQEKIRFLSNLNNELYSQLAYKDKVHETMETAKDQIIEYQKMLIELLTKDNQSK